jgi:hypothetical protein
MDHQSIDRKRATAKTPESKSALPSKRPSLLSSLFPTSVAVDHTADDDTVLDIKIGNPLRRITQLLEDIKKQKAFSFTLKGSLGLAGIALVITSFGVFGGTKAFCSKGVQSHIGTLKILNMVDAPDRSPIAERVMVVWDAMTGNDFTRRTRQRMVLVRVDETVLTIKERVDGLTLGSFVGQVIATGEFDSCSNTLTLKDINAVETY